MTIVDDTIRQTTTVLERDDRDDRFRVLFRSMPLPAFLWQWQDGDFVLIETNDAGATLTKGGVARYFGVRATEFFQDLPETLADFYRCRREGVMVHREASQVLKSTGYLRDLKVTLTPLRHDSVVAFLQDMTEQNVLKRDLHTSREEFRTIADFTYDWEYLRSPDGRLSWVSPSCERITGYTPREFTENSDLFYAIIHPQDRPVVETVLNDRTIGRYCHLDFRIVRRDGDVRWVSHNCQAVYGENGVFLGRRASTRDVTGRKEVEQRLLAYQEQLRSLASELSLAEERERRRIAVDLHDRVGHTLAMSQIKLNQLQKAVNSPKISKDMDVVVDLIESAIADARSLTMEISPPALYELGLEAALDELAQEIEDEHGIMGEVVDDGLPKPLGADSRIALYRAVRECMINVVKHARATRLDVSLRTIGDKISVEVSDNGVGFDARVHQQDEWRNKSFGLFSIRERMNHMGGKMSIKSLPNQGTVVTLTAPLERMS